MTDEKEIGRLVDQFVLDEIDSVPHLEALLLLWSHQPKEWSSGEMGKSLYVDAAFAERVLKDLAQRKLAVGQTEPDRYSYNAGSEERNKLVGSLDAIYRREIVRISRMIHAKGSLAVREFAKAFRFTKDRE
jgi:hypothetical protein